MNYQNEIKTEKPLQKDKSTEHNLLTIERDIATQNQPSTSSVFKLKIDGWEEVFDWLLLTDLHAFGQTCKIFH